MSKSPKRAAKAVKEPSYYLRSVAAVKAGAAKVARSAERQYKLPAGSVHVSITKLGKAHRSRLAAS